MYRRDGGRSIALKRTIPRRLSQYLISPRIAGPCQRGLAHRRSVFLCHFEAVNAPLLGLALPTVQRKAEGAGV
jgi:hypothetical protein